MTREHILGALRRHDPFSLPAYRAQRAAVLVPLLNGAEGTEVLLTRRSERVLDHSGQVAFPGGRLEPQDDGPVRAALREAEEELGIPPQRVEVLGRLDDMLTITGFHVVPVVGWVEDGVRFVPNPVEVARVFTVPLAALMTAERWERRTHSYRGNELLVWHFPYAGEDVWGATATMLRGMVELLWERTEPAAGRG